MSTSGYLPEIGPDQLPGINFRGGQHAGDQAREHGGQQDIAPRIVGLFGKRGDAVEPDVGEHRDGRAAGDASQP